MNEELAVDLDRLGSPLFENPHGYMPTKATQLTVEPCDINHARLLVAKWHSRLPETQRGPWKYAFRASFDGITYGVALWHNPSARTLPSHWLELRRLAVAPDAPRFTASRMLGQMRRWFQIHEPEAEKLISYQDMEVHTGTIYRAAGWSVGNISTARARDRTGFRPSGRMYRWNQNEDAPDHAAKTRWEMDLV